MAYYADVVHVQEDKQHKLTMIMCHLWAAGYDLTCWARFLLEDRGRVS